MDTVGDFLTIVRNASSAHKRTCSMFASNMRVCIAEVLKKCGFIQDYILEEIRPQVKKMEIVLKYVGGRSAISGIERCSRPGCRSYCDCNSIPRVLNNLGICILATSKGILSGGDAVQNRVGGELLCKVW